MKVIDLYNNAQTKQPTAYDNYEAALTNKTDWGIKADGGSMDSLTIAHNVSIRTDATITISINSTSADDITIASTDSPFTLSDITISEIYITNTGIANVKIMTW